MSAISHNLDIQSYRLEELLSLLDLPFKPTQEQMMRAKKKVLMFHPDKSRLPNEYFLFYRKAFDIAVKYYQEQNKQNVVLTEENTTYQNMKPENDESVDKTIKQNIEKIGGGKAFQSKFNELFEKNMVEKRENKNAWFAEEKPVLDVPEEKVSSKNMSTLFEKMKEKTQSIVVHKGVQDYMYRAGGKFLDDEEEEDYISTDPFSKLRYDDLRKVHKDQTIFAVGENDFKKVPQYGSVDQYQRERNSMPVISKQSGKFDPSKKTAYEMEQETKLKQQYEQRLFQENLKTERYMDLNKKIQANFLHLK